MKKIVVCLVLAWVLTVNHTFADEDILGSHDHLLVSRMEGYYIAGYESNYNEAIIPFPDSAIRPESFAVLEEITEMLKSDPPLKLRIEGHTDDQGQSWANLELSMQRARSVALAIHEKGIAAERLAVSGFGQSKPVADNTTEKGRAENRRVTLVKL